MGNFSNCLPLNHEESFYRPSSRSAKTRGQERFLHERPEKQGRVKYDAPSAVISDPVKSPSDLSEIQQSMQSHFILKQIYPRAQLNIIRSMNLYSLAADSLIFKQGSMGKTFFIIRRGNVQIQVNSNPKCILRNGDSFGELALLHNSRRTASAVTTSPCQLWGICGNTFRQAVKAIRQSQYQETRAFIEKIHIFDQMTTLQKDSLLEKFVTREYSDGEFIVREGDKGGALYIIQEGLVKCLKGDREVRNMGKGESFGEQALLFESIRTASVVSLGASTVLSLGGKDLIKALGNNLEVVLYKNIAKVAIDKRYTLTSEQKEILVDKMHVQRFSAGESLKSSDSLRILLKGKIRSWSSDEEFNVYQTLGTNEYYAVVNSLVYEITSRELELCLGGTLSETVDKNTAFNILKKINIFKCLSDDQIRNLCSVLKSETLTGQIFQEGDTGNAVYIVREGKVNIYIKSSYIRTIGKNDYFGERSILFNETRTATATAKETAVCWSLSKNDFLHVIDEAVRVQLQKRIELQDDTVRLHQLSAVRLLGKGSFGNVHLARHSSKGTLYALKTIPRKKIARYDIYECVVLERKVLLQIDHPMIIKLVKTFKDPKRVYFLMEYVQGIDFFDVIRLINVIPNKTAKFYTACLMSMLSHLHENSIVYRDLKPENVIIDQEGYPKLIDFGVARIIDCRTYTMIGSSHYMAPEVISGKGYGLAVDYWSVGIILYEMLNGFFPFGNEYDDPYAVYECILNQTLAFPFDINPKARMFIRKLLDRNPFERGNCKSIMSLPYLRNFDHDKLLGRLIEAPFIPEMVSEFAGNCDLNECILNEEQLERGFSRIVEPVGWDYQF